MIDFDCETDGLQPWSRRQRAFLYIFGDDEGNVETIHRDSEDAEDKIQKWFFRAAADDEGIRAWNSKFDRAFADVGGFTVPEDGKWHDGMLVAHTIDERRSVALKAVSQQLFGENAADLQREVKDYLTSERRQRKSEAHKAGSELIEPNFEDVPMTIMEPYAREDVVLTRKVSEAYEPVIEQSPDLKATVEFEREVMDGLYAVEKLGLPASEDEYRKLEIEVVQNLEALDERVKELAGDKDFNPNSPPQVIEALKRRKADMSYMSEKNGKLSADVENLNAVDDELARAILDFRAEYKVLSTYVRPYIGRHYDSSLRMHKEPFIGSDGRIHANYRQVGARTGRMSCSDPNMQNQPRDDLRLRYNICAGEGKSLVTCDLSNIEMVLFAAYAGEGRLLEAVRRGDDLHVLTAQMLGIRDRARAGGAVESARQRGKTFNFSIIYGGGLRTIKRQQRCTQDEARLMKRRYYEAYPEVERLQRRIEYRLQDQGYIADKLISGRRFRVDPRDAYKATNYLVQGTAAALLKWALIQLHKDGVPIVALVHDEIVAEIDKSDAEEAKRLIIQRLTEHPGLNDVVPLRADGEIVQRWSDAKPNKDGSLFIPNWAKAA